MYGSTQSLQAFRPQTVGISNNPLDEITDKAKEWINKGEEQVDITKEKVEEVLSPDVTDKEKEGILTKVKRKFNDADPLLIGGIGAGASWMFFKTGPLTTAIVGGLCYLGKMQLDKSGGLSDTFNTNDMDYDSVTPNGVHLYKNKTNGRLYYVSSYDNSGVPIWTQYS
jgi:hypothetical protein